MKYSELQEENKQLKEQLKYLRKNEYLNQVKWKKDFNEYLVKEFKTRIKKAIEYIKDHELNNNKISEMLCGSEIVELLDILRGEDNEI